MSNAVFRLLTTLSCIVALIGLTGTPSMAQSTSASTLPGQILPLPNPPGAPQQDMFLVTIPHAHVVPTQAVFHFESRTGQKATATASLKKLNKIQYKALWKATERGRVKVDVYAAQHRLIAQASYPVKKAHVNVAGRVLIGGLFIIASVWLWWRQRRFRP